MASTFASTNQEEFALAAKLTLALHTRTVQGPRKQELLKLQRQLLTKQQLPMAM